MDLTDEQWNLIEPILLLSSGETRSSIVPSNWMVGAAPTPWPAIVDAKLGRAKLLLSLVFYVEKQGFGRGGGLALATGPWRA
jgi:hypothetical protein